MPGVSLPPCCAPSACATEDVVTASSGMLSILVMLLYTLRATPALARGLAPRRPMNAVLTRLASGSAARVAMVGRAISRISASMLPRGGAGPPSMLLSAAAVAATARSPRRRGWRRSDAQAARCNAATAAAPAAAAVAGARCSLLWKLPLGTTTAWQPADAERLPAWQCATCGRAIRAEKSTQLVEFWPSASTGAYVRIDSGKTSTGSPAATGDLRYTLPYMLMARSCAAFASQPAKNLILAAIACVCEPWARGGRWQAVLISLGSPPDPDQSGKMVRTM